MSAHLSLQHLDAVRSVVRGLLLQALPTIDTAQDAVKAMSELVAAVHETASDTYEAWNARKSKSLARLLPVEILAGVFEALSDNDIGTIFGVSRRWRKIALRTPILSSHITLRQQRNQLDSGLRRREYLGTVLARSGGVPLRLTWRSDDSITVPPDDDALQMLIPHITRLVHISLAYVHLPSGFINCAQRLKSFTSTTDVHLAPVGFHSTLASVCANDLILDQQRGAPHHSIQYLDISRMLDNTGMVLDAGEVFECFPNLVRLSIRVDSLTRGAPYAPPSSLSELSVTVPCQYRRHGADMFPETFRLWTPLSVPRLSRVTFHGEDPSCVSPRVLWDNFTAGHCIWDLQWTECGIMQLRINNSDGGTRRLSIAMHHGCDFGVLLASAPNVTLSTDTLMELLNNPRMSCILPSLVAWKRLDIVATYYSNCQSEMMPEQEQEQEPQHASGPYHLQELHSLAIRFPLGGATAADPHETGPAFVRSRLIPWLRTLFVFPFLQSIVVDGWPGGVLTPEILGSLASLASGATVTFTTGTVTETT